MWSALTGETLLSGANKNGRVASPESVHIHLICKDYVAMM